MSRRCDGLLLVYSDPGGVPEPEFHHWYDDVHIPPRLQVPGVHAAYRYREADGAVPRWAALYPLRLDALRTDAYRAARERSPSESALIDRLATLDRRVYTRVDTGVHTAPAPAPFLLVVGLSSDDPDGLDQWYAEEHVPLLALVPGWLRTTRYRRTEGGWAGPSGGPRAAGHHGVRRARVPDRHQYSGPTGGHAVRQGPGASDAETPPHHDSSRAARPDVKAVGRT